MFRRIKCHHNDIAKYIQNMYLLNKSDFSNFKENKYSYFFHSHNYEFFPTDFKNKFIHFYLCQYNYINIVKILLSHSMRIDLNESNIIRLF